MFVFPVSRSLKIWYTVLDSLANCPIGLWHGGDAVLKQNTAFSVLLMLALAVTSLCVWYNLSLREEFAVIVGYMPPQPLPEPTAAVPESGLPWGYEEDDADAPDYTAYETGPVTVVVEFPLDLNTATLDQLMYVPGIGSVTAQRIAQYREVLGGYSNLAQLMEIKGIGEVNYQNIAPYFVISNAEPGEISDRTAEDKPEPE